MKLTAPPPPPPEPPEPPEPNPASASAPSAAAAPTPFSPTLITAPDPSAAAQTQPAPAGPAAWPTWYPRADLVIAGLALLLGFLVASFAARNPDVWVHLAAGKRMAGGTYFPGGSDPFSYSAAGRAWVNHSWLWDFAAYVLYGGSGILVVFVKAVAVAAAGALLLAICRPGYPVWPWAALLAVAYLAAAPRLTLSPLAGSVLLLSVTLFTLFRLPSRPGSWRVPITLGVTFWVWACTDAWFFLGPLTVALLLAGEFVQRKYLELTETKGDEADAGPLGRLPDEKTLLRALAVGVAACGLTPHHVRVWQLPFELVGSDVIKADPTMNVGLNLAPTDKLFFEQERLGYNLNGLAYAVLLAGGGLALGLGAGFGTGSARPRLAVLVLWVAVAAMSMVSVYAIPFLAVVAVPLVAAQLNAFSVRARLGKPAERRTRLLLLGSSGGRVLSVAGLLAACACAWPGWLHPPLADTGGARRVAWKVEPDAELTRAAQQIQQWHAGGAMPPDSHGLIASVALADYCAWFAPDERVFVNSRFQHHRPELPEFVAVRGAVGIIDRPDEPPSRKDVAAVLKKHNAVFVALYNSRGQVGTRSIAQRERGGFGSVWDVFGWDDWATWYLDGRTVVIGWRPGADAAGVAGEQVALDPVALAFGPTTPRIPAGRIVPARTPAWSDEFFRRPRPSSGYADEALGWVDYKQALRMRSTTVHLTGVLMRLNAPAAAGPPVYAAVEAAQDEFLIRTGRYAPPNLPDGSFHATPVLAVRAAFRAIAAEPDNPDGYFALAAALDDPDLPLTDGERAVGRIVALRRCLDRLPPPDQYRPGVANTSPTTAAETLARLYLGLTPDGRFGGVPLNLRPTPSGIAGLGRILPIDLALKTLERANEYAEVEFKNSAPETRQNLRKVYDEQLKRLRDAVRERSAEYDRLRERARTVSGQYDAALQTGLIGEATRILQESGDLGKDFGPNSRAAAVQLAALLLCSGKLEEAAEALEVMRKESDAANAADPTVAGMRAWVRVLEYHVAVTSGNFPAAGAILEGLEGPAVLNRPAFPLSRDTHGPVTPTVVPLPGANGPVGEMAWLLPGLEQSPVIGYLGMRTLIRNQLDREATYFHLRGMLALLEGDVPAARAFFLQGFRTPPAGWNMTEVYPVAALDYLQLIRLAELPPADRRALFRPKAR